MPPTIKPQTFAHVVYRTRRFDEMLAWYQTVFGATVQFQSPALAFLTYDHEHHRFAILNLTVLQPEEAPNPAGNRHSQIDHVAYGYRSLTELCEKFAELRQKDILPYWCVHHGITISMYYADPDGNRMEFQADCFKSNEEANAFLEGPHFLTNPIGVEFEPEQLLAGIRAGEPETAFLPRVSDFPISVPRQPPGR